MAAVYPEVPRKMRLSKRISRRWIQFCAEVTDLISGFQILLVNLDLIGRLRPALPKSITVIVDSRREATILRLLSILRLLPRHNILVVLGAHDLDLLMRLNCGIESLLIVTSRVFIKHYQLLARLRTQRRLLVVL